MVDEAIDRAMIQRIHQLKAAYKEIYKNLKQVSLKKTTDEMALLENEYDAIDTELATREFGYSNSLLEWEKLQEVREKIIADIPAS